MLAKFPSPQALATDSFEAYISLCKGWSVFRLRHLEVITVSAPFSVLCKCFAVNKCVSQSGGLCWNPMKGLWEATRKQRNVVDGQHMSLQRAPLLTREDIWQPPSKTSEAGASEGFHDFSSQHCWTRQSSLFMKLTSSLNTLKQPGRMLIISTN